MIDLMAWAEEMKRTSKQTEVRVLFFFTACSILFESAWLRAIGFSMITALPASEAAMVCSGCRKCGVQMSTMSTAGSARNLR